MNIKRWLLCAFLFLICFLILRWLNNAKIIEGYGCHGGCHCRGCHCRGGHGHRGGGHYGVHGGYYNGGGAYSPIYIYDDQPYWYRYIPFF
jgi:hypothetical protein